MNWTLTFRNQALDENIRAVVDAIGWAIDELEARAQDPPSPALPAEGREPDNGWCAAEGREPDKR